MLSKKEKRKLKRRRKAGEAAQKEYGKKAARKVSEARKRNADTKLRKAERKAGIVRLPAVDPIRRMMGL